MPRLAPLVEGAAFDTRHGEKYRDMERRVRLDPKVAVEERHRRGILAGR